MARIDDPTGPIPGDNDPTHEQLRCIRETELVSVSAPADCRIRLTINGDPAARSGSKQVTPTRTTSYTLAGSVGLGANRSNFTLGGARVRGRDAAGPTWRVRRCDRRLPVQEPLRDQRGAADGSRARTGSAARAQRVVPQACPAYRRRCFRGSARGSGQVLPACGGDSGGRCRRTGYRHRLGFNVSRQFHMSEQGAVCEFTEGSTSIVRRQRSRRPLSEQLGRR